jgi:F-type H+-transporting ATPase subunit a
MMFAQHEVAEAGAAAAAHGERFNPGTTILHHITDSNFVEVPWYRYPFSRQIELPHIHIAGLDLSITKHVLMMWITAAFLIILFGLLFRKRRAVPKGIVNLFELVVVFIRDEVAYKSIGEKEGKKYVPYLLTVFFFILGCNFLGLLPFGAKPTGNINVTGTLAAISFIVIQVSGMVRYGPIRHFKNLVPAGIPLLLLPIMIPVEIMGMFAKPFALCIRLFANMAAGHVIILALISLIFIFGSIFMAPLVVAFALFVSLLEILVALLQAYIFTMLTALFISMSVHVAH